MVRRDCRKRWWDGRRPWNISRYHIPWRGQCVIAVLGCWTEKVLGFKTSPVFLYNKTNQMHQFPKFTPVWNSTCFGQFLCPSSGVYSLYTQQWCMSYSFEDSFRAGPFWSCSKAIFKAVWHTPLLSVQWINSWWWAEELPETCRVSYRSKSGKLVHLVGFTIRQLRCTVTWT